MSSSQRIAVMRGLLAEAQQLQSGLNLFGSRKRKKAKRRINAEISKIKKQFNAEKKKLDALIRSKNISLSRINSELRKLRRENVQLKNIQKQIITIIT